MKGEGGREVSIECARACCEVWHGAVCSTNSRESATNLLCMSWGRHEDAMSSVFHVL